MNVVVDDVRKVKTCDLLGVLSDGEMESQLTVVSRPSVTIMKKKMMAQNEAPPIVATASGYTTKMRPTSVDTNTGETNARTHKRTHSYTHSHTLTHLLSASAICPHMFIQHTDAHTHKMQTLEMRSVSRDLPLRATCSMGLRCTKDM